MTVKELIETLKTCDEKSEVKIEHLDSTVYPIEEYNYNIYIIFFTKLIKQLNL